MILDNIRYSSRYAFLGSQFMRAFDYLKNVPADIKDGRYELPDCEDYSLPQTYIAKNPSECKFEAHQCYVDIQLVVEGSEIIYYRDAARLQPLAPYNAERDVIFFHDPQNASDATPLHLYAGDFAIFWPQDGHKPSCALDVNTPAHVRKIVVKLKLPSTSAIR